MKMPVKHHMALTAKFNGLSPIDIKSAIIQRKMNPAQVIDHIIERCEAAWEMGYREGLKGGKKEAKNG